MPIPTERAKEDTDNKSAPDAEFRDIRSLKELYGTRSIFISIAQAQMMIHSGMPFT